MIANINLSNAIIASITLMSVVDALPAGGKPIDSTVPAQATELQAYISQKYDNPAQATSRLASYISDKQVPTATFVNPTRFPHSDKPAPTATAVYESFKPVTYDDGQYHPPTSYDDGSYKHGKPTDIFIHPIPSHHPIPSDFPISWIAPITTYPISDGVPTGVPTKPTFPISDGAPTGIPYTSKKVGFPTVITDYFPGPKPTYPTSIKVGPPTIITDTFPEPTIVSILPIPTNITSFVTQISTSTPSDTVSAPVPTEEPYTPADDSDDTDDTDDTVVPVITDVEDTEGEDDEGDDY